MDRALSEADARLAGVPPAKEKHAGLRRSAAMSTWLSDQPGLDAALLQFLVAKFHPIEVEIAEQKPSHIAQRSLIRLTSKPSCARRN